jgi:hypothetical protein
MSKVAVLCLFLTLTLAGTLAIAGLELNNDTTTGVPKTVPDRVTVPFAERFPVTLIGFKLKPVNEGVMLSFSLTVVPLYVAEIMAEADEVTALVLMANVAVLFPPAATVTVSGTIARAGLLLESLTTAPSAGTKPVILTVPVDALPPATILGSSVSEDRAAAGAPLMAKVRPTPRRN